MNPAQAYREALAALDRLAAFTTVDRREGDVRRLLEQIAPLCDPYMYVDEAVAAMLTKDTAGDFKGAHRATLAKRVVALLEAGPLFVQGVGTLHLRGGPGCQQVTLEPIDWLD